MAQSTSEMPIDTKPDAKSMCERAMSGVFSLWQTEGFHAWRSSREWAQLQHVSGEGEGYYPTATSHAILAMEECGIWSEGAVHFTSIRQLKTPEFTISGIPVPPTPGNILGKLLSLRPPDVPADRPDAWFSQILSSTSHREVGKGDGTPPPRISILLGHLLPAVRAMMNRIDEPMRQAVAPKIQAALDITVSTLKRALSQGAEQRCDEVWLSEHQGLSPHLLLYAVIALKECEELDAMLGNAEKHRSRPNPAEQLLLSLKGYFVRQVDRLMARSQVPMDPTYDSNSLAFALRGLDLLERGVRSTPFYRACVRAVVAGQRDDGCWPDGISVTFSPSGDTVQQPSIEVALQLAHCVFRKRALERHEPHDIDLIEIVLPALHRAMRYLEATYQNFEELQHHFSGWSSDRVRSPRNVEIWITAMAARLSRLVGLAETILGRAKTLTHYGATFEEWPNGNDGKPLAWSTEVKEPDSIIKPTELLYSQFVEPIQKRQLQGDYYVRPDKKGVSFIIYGPPGSGKTFFVKKFAAAVGWPLLSLNPGHFIRRGLEFIEANASEIFGDLMRLDHAVVFFDECDELFRDRDAVEGGFRNILSFATACMLPKLQDLHDARRVVFILGTNYLSRMDAAVRRQGRFDEVLLFDRPDETARRNIIREKINNTRGAAPLDEEISSLAALTSGLMHTEVAEVAAAHAKSFVYPTIDNSDYERWCRQWGEKELAASRTPREAADAVRNRWGSLYSSKFSTTITLI